MESIVWLAIIVSFISGIAVNASSQTPGTILAAGWGTAVIAITVYLISKNPAPAAFEIFAAAFAGSLAAFFAGFALFGLIRDWRNRKKKTA